MTDQRDRLPLVYSCSGCSSAAQTANHMALGLDRRGAAEMSCIAGLGGDVPPLLKLARSGRPIIAIDGCALDCTRLTLARHGLTPFRHVQLRTMGVKKRPRADYDPGQAERLVGEVLADLAAASSPPPPAGLAR